MRTRPSETFIVRIYRRLDQEPDAIVGIVEETVSQNQTPFHSLQELGALLANSPKKSAERPTRD